LFSFLLSGWLFLALIPASLLHFCFPLFLCHPVSIILTSTVIFVSAKASIIPSVCAELAVLFIVGVAKTERRTKLVITLLLMLCKLVTVFDNDASKFVQLIFLFSVVDGTLIVLTIFPSPVTFSGKH